MSERSSRSRPPVRPGNPLLSSPSPDGVRASHVFGGSFRLSCVRMLRYAKLRAGAGLTARLAAHTPPSSFLCCVV